MWTIIKIINWTTDYFKNKGIPNPRLDAELLLSHVLNCDRIDLYLNYDKPLGGQELLFYKRLIQRRARREPLQYIIGETEFRSLKIKVDRRVFIPRPETEILVEQTLKAISKFSSNGQSIVRILEIGTGSGAISLALANELTSIWILATDKFPLALELAQSNIKKHNLDHRISVVCGDLFKPFKKKRYFHLIISNPPYISPREFAYLQPEVRNFEPKDALVARENGLLVIRKILEAAPSVLYPNGAILMEIGYGQVERIVKIIKKLKYLTEPTFFKDYANIERVVETFYKEDKKVG